MTTFLDWLKVQKDRNDPVGDFARDAEDDKTRPGSSSLMVWMEHLGDVHACKEAKQALVEAHAEYRATQPDGYVYVWGGAGIYKIGRAKNPRQRVKTFPIMPYETGFAHILPTSNSKHLERQLHSHFREQHLQGEWFQLSTDDLETIPMVAETPSLSEADLSVGRSHWQLLVELEPRLLELYREARAVKDTRESVSFCANEIWYVRFKPRLMGLVGWEVSKSADLRLRTMDAWDTAYDKVYEALPNCRSCWCMPSNSDE